MKRCTNSVWGEHPVQSDSSNKIYTVTIRSSLDHFCTCPALSIQRNKRKKAGDPSVYDCKHIKAVLVGSQCPWNSETGAPQQYPEICPVCASPVEWVDEVLEDPDDEKLNDTLAGLLALKDRLS